MTTPNLALETVASNTLQPSVPVNDAFQVLDALVQLSVETITATPPTTVGGDVGKRWIVDTGATGTWAGEDGSIALCTAATVWRFFAPAEGWRADVRDEDSIYRYTGSAWDEVVSSTSIPGYPVNALTNSAGTVTVNCSLGRDFTLTLAANVTTLTLSNLAGAGNVTEIEIEIKQDATGGRTFAIPASFKAIGASDTAVASAANAVTILSAKTFDNGTTWRYVMQETA
jgi:hypothetical protein